MAKAFDSVRTLDINQKIFHYYSIQSLAELGIPNINRLPYSLKILAENLLRHHDEKVVTSDDLLAFNHWLEKRSINHEIAYHPARVLMQDFTGVPAVVDLAAMRDAMTRLGGSASDINPLCPVDLVIDHSVQVDFFGSNQAYKENVEVEMQRNGERYTFLKWGQASFSDFNVVPPGTGICHQVNLEYLAQGVWHQTREGICMAYPDTLVGTDSHTTMINGLGVLGWGVGGIEAEAALLGQPISMLIPDVIGFRLIGELNDGITATDLVLTVTEKLRERGVVGKFVEFFGPGLKHLPLADRATISNMAPEYGATCGIFPIDTETLRYMKLSNRSTETIELTKAYMQAQGMWHDDDTPEAIYTDVLELNLNDVKPSVAGPKRPQDKVLVSELANVAKNVLSDHGKSDEADKAFSSETGFDMHHGDIVIAAITSCTNTSNPSVMLAAGLLAKKACEQGLSVKPWVKCSLAPGSKVVTEYLQQAGLQPYLEQLGFYLVGYGCTTCIGNSGPLSDAVTKTIQDNDLVVCAVLSGNRNFEGRIHPLVQANWLASPPLVVAYALTGTICQDLANHPLGVNNKGESVFLKDIWPSEAEIATATQAVSQQMFRQEYAEVFSGTPEWQAIDISRSENYQWQADSTYVRNPPFFEGMSMLPAPIEDIQNATILALLGDSVTTDHISPAGAIKADSPAGTYLQSQGVAIKDFNSYGSRRGNHEVMMRGTFANIRIRNEMVPEVEGGYTCYQPSQEQLPIYDAAMKYKEQGVPLVVIAGKEYGTGSSRDWAAKGTLLLGVKAVIAESFERIHRSNLIGMGVLPLQFKTAETRKTLKITGQEKISIKGLEQAFTPGMDVTMTITRSDNSQQTLTLTSRIDTENEANYYRHGGILQYVLRGLVKQG